MIWNLFRISCFGFIIFTNLAFAHQEPTLQFLRFWPSARATGLAGSFTGIADDAYTAYYNPAGLPFLKEKHIALTHSNVLSGLYPGIFYECLSYSSPLKDKHGFGVFIPYFTNGVYRVIGPAGEPLWEDRSYCLTVAAAYGYQVKKAMGLGAAVKFIYYHGYYDYWWWWPPWDDAQGVGIPVGPGLTYAADFGVFYKPTSRFSFGFTVQNLGPKIHISDPYFSSDLLPLTFRLGIKYQPVNTKIFSLIIAPEITKDLIGMFYDPEDTLSFLQELGYELKEAWKSLGFELSIYNIFSLRLGYFEDVTGGRGGLVINDGGHTSHISIADFLSGGKEKRNGKFEGLGLTIGGGIKFKGFQFDIGFDQWIYDFRAQDYKISLSYRF